MAKQEAFRAGAYRPALDDHARRLIARIQRDHRDTEAVLALKAHYEAHGDLPSLANLMEGWAHTLRAPEAAAAAYVAAAEAALASGDPARARWIYRLALERSPGHERARASLAASEPVAPPVSGIRAIDADAPWLEEEHLEPLAEGEGARSGRYEETQRIWRP